MIKATARSAPDREKEINNLVLRARFHEDQFVRDFGISINNQMAEVKGRILTAPKIQYGGKVNVIFGFNFRQSLSIFSVFFGFYFVEIFINRVKILFFYFSLIFSHWGKKLE